MVKMVFGGGVNFRCNICVNIYKIVIKLVGYFLFVFNFLVVY